jgi:hypothetical protein
MSFTLGRGQILCSVLTVTVDLDSSVGAYDGMRTDFVRHAFLYLCFESYLTSALRKAGELFRIYSPFVCEPYSFAVSIVLHRSFCSFWQCRRNYCERSTWTKSRLWACGCICDHPDFVHYPSVRAKTPTCSNYEASLPTKCCLCQRWRFYAVSHVR